MIKITNGQETISIPNSRLQKITEKSNDRILKAKHDFWDIEFVFAYNKNGQILRIIKRYKGGDESLEVYKNNSKQNNIVLLDDHDYQKWKKAYIKMNDNHDYEKEAIVSAGAIILSYEYYKTFNLEENPERLDISDLFEFFKIDFDYNKYKKEIIEQAKKYIPEIYSIKIDK